MFLKHIGAMVNRTMTVAINESESRMMRSMAQKITESEARLLKALPIAMLQANEDRATCEADALYTALSLASAEMGYNHTCSGSLLGSPDSNLVMTASHCVDNTKLRTSQGDLSFSMPMSSLVGGALQLKYSFREARALLVSTKRDLAILILRGEHESDFDYDKAALQLRNVVAQLKPHWTAPGTRVVNTVHAVGDDVRVRTLTPQLMARPGILCAKATSGKVRLALTDNAAARVASGKRAASQQGGCAFYGKLQPVRQEIHGGNSGAVVFTAVLHNGKCIMLPHSIVSAQYTDTSVGLLSAVPTNLPFVLETLAAMLQSAVPRADVGKTLGDGTFPLYHLDCMEDDGDCSVRAHMWFAIVMPHDEHDATPFLQRMVQIRPAPEQKLEQKHVADDEDEPEAAV